MKLLSLLICLGCTFFVACHAKADDAPTTAPSQSLLANGDFSVDSNNDGAPDNWPAKLPDGASWTKDEGKIILKIVSPEAGKNVTVYQRMTLKPDHPGVMALTAKVRYADVKVGEKTWFDARIMLNWKDAENKPLKPQPPAPAFKGTSKGWVEKTVYFRVPEKASFLEIMPSMFQAASGRFEIASIEVTEAGEDKLPPPPVMVPSQPMKYEGAALPPPLKVVGNKLQDPSGKDVWLQGLCVDSLEWSAVGEHIQQSIPVAIDQWHANVIRLPVKEDFWFGWGKWQQKDKDGFKYREIVDQAVKDCASRGAYLILDLHRFGAPNDKHIAFWQDAAMRYKNHPAVIFELFNEPHDLSWKSWRDGGKVKEGAEDKGVVENTEAIDADTTPGMQAMVDAVRSTGANNLIIAGGLDWSFNLSGVLKGFALTDKEGTQGIMYTAHCYPWKKGWQKAFLDVAEKYPVLMGEIGNLRSWDDFKFISEKERYEEVGVNSEWPNDMLATIQKYKLHWTGFSFHPKCGPMVISDWNYTPTEYWGVYVKRALAGEQFELKKIR